MLHVPSGPRVSLLRCRRSSVAIVVAMLAPVLAGAAGLGIEVSNWSVEQMRMQRAADVAALAGAITYNNTVTNGGTTASAAQAAATAAANLAEINHVPGPTSPSWDSTTQTLTDSNLTVKIVNGLRSASDTAIQVSVQESVPLMIARVVTANSSVTVSGTSTAELLSNGNGSSTGPQPCVFAMSTASDAIGVTANGYISVTAPGCTLRSNSVINFSGGGSFNTGGLYAAGDIDIPTWVSVTGGKYPDDGTVTDPYASNTSLQTVLTDASTVTGPSIACYNQWCKNGSTAMPTSSGSSFNGS
ncbi:MAG TPA: pilus assembly protein TadG-related protein, partial [Acetobacteraceae bacterium]|nr:pilus assembly protein TadG-related protein [Acetobacteraceae bacterium]